MWLKYPFIFLIFFILGLFQFSFLPYLNIGGAVLNAFFILFFVLAFFSLSNQGFRKNKSFYLGADVIYLAIISGFFADVFSSSVFGSYTVSFLIISFFVKISLHNLKEGQDKFSVLYFILLFLPAFVFNKLFSDLILYLTNHLYPTNLSWIFIGELAYNLLLATIVFYVFKKLQDKK